MRLLSRLFAVILILPNTALAQQAPTLQLPDSADVRIIVDISGSMKTNDPDNLRRPLWLKRPLRPETSLFYLDPKNESNK